MTVQALKGRLQRERGARLLISLMGIVFVALFSYSTSFLHPHFYGGDSAQFLTYGKLWAQGKIPYIDTFDHKGPLIFFIDMLGFLLFGSKTGVCFLQMVFMIFSLNAVYSISQEARKNAVFGVCTVVLTLIVLKFNYGEGNMTEEYCLPFVAWSLLLQLRYLKQARGADAAQHPPLHAALYGAAFGVCFLTRITNAIPVCCGVLVIAVMLLAKRRFACLLKNAGGFLAGFSAVSLPFFAYFAAFGALDDMFHASFTLNFAYVGSAVSWTYPLNSGNLLLFLRLYLPTLLILLASVIAFAKRRPGRGCLYLLMGLLEVYLSAKSALYSQYAIVYAPQVALLLFELYDEADPIDPEGILRIMVVGGLLVHGHYVLETNAITAANTFLAPYNSRFYGWDELVGQIPQDERDSVIAWGHDSLKGFYLATGIDPCYKYCFIQDWHASFHEGLAQDIVAEFREGSAKWILADGTTARIDDILAERYELVSAQGHLRLFHLKDVP